MAFPIFIGTAVSEFYWQGRILSSSVEIDQILFSSSHVFPGVVEFDSVAGVTALNIELERTINAQSHLQATMVADTHLSNYRAVCTSMLGTGSFKLTLPYTSGNNVTNLVVPELVGCSYSFSPCSSNVWTISGAADLAYLGKLVSLHLIFYLLFF